MNLHTFPPCAWEDQRVSPAHRHSICQRCWKIVHHQPVTVGGLGNKSMRGESPACTVQFSKQNQNNKTVSAWEQPVHWPLTQSGSPTTIKKPKTLIYSCSYLLGVIFFFLSSLFNYRNLVKINRSRKNGAFQQKFFRKFSKSFKKNFTEKREMLSVHQWAALSIWEGCYGILNKQFKSVID